MSSMDWGEALQERLRVADLIAGMTETQIVQLYQRLTGSSLGSAFDAYVRV